jgi:enterochelin esterase family protein
MKCLLAAVIVTLLAADIGWTQEGMDDFYKLGPDSLAQDGVPKGTISDAQVLPCSVYPGTQHTYWVYLRTSWTT